MLQVIKYKYQLLLTFALAVFLLTRLYNFPNRVSFDYDQQKAAEVAWQMIVDKKPTLLGIETSVGGLFTGPGLYYMQTFAMFIGNLDPIYLGYSSVLFSLITLLAIFFVTKEIFSPKVAIVAVFIYIISFRVIIYDTAASPISYIMLPSILVILFLHKLLVQKRKQYFVYLMLILGLATHVHLALGLLIPAVILQLILVRPKINLKVFFIGLGAFLLPLFPLVLFELRHDLFITKNLIQFLSSSQELNLRLVEVLKIPLAMGGETVFTNRYALWAVVIITATYFVFDKKNKWSFLKTYAFILVIPPALFSFYIGPIPEYYFIPQLPLIIMLAGFVYAKIFSKFPIPSVFLIFFVVNYNFGIFMTSTYNPLSYYTKRTVVESILDSANGQDFKLLYRVPIPVSYGFDYMFKWKGNVPNDESENLYLLEYQFSGKEVEDYKKMYSDKQLEFKLISDYYVIAVHPKNE